MRTLHYGEESVSVAFEEVPSANWKPQSLRARNQSKSEPALQET
ncbi:hypothetical protein [Edaphobacter sp.]|nr:hypothetical protein [Edaphobacter sp.]